MLIFIFLFFRKTTTHCYFTRSNKKRIMSNFEQENDATRESLALLQVQMGTILEHLQIHRDNVVIVNQVDATPMVAAVDTTLVVMDPTDPIVPPIAVSQPLSHVGPSRLVAAYPWGMPHNHNPQFAIGNSFMPYMPFPAAPTNLNHVAFPWGMHNLYSAQGVETEETHVVDSVEE